MERVGMMTTKAWTVRFKASKRARKVYEWTRFAPNAMAAQWQAENAVRDEYGDKGVVVSVEPAGWSA